MSQPHFNHHSTTLNREQTNQITENQSTTKIDINSGETFLLNDTIFCKTSTLQQQNHLKNQQRIKSRHLEDKKGAY